MRLHRVLSALLVIAFGLAPCCLTAQRDTTDRGVIRGILFDMAGRPIQHVLVGLVADSGGPGAVLRNSAKPYRNAEITDDDGRFQFTSLAPGKYTLSFEDMWTRADSGSLALRANDTLSVDLRSRVSYYHVTPDSVRARRLAELAEAKARWATHRPKRYRLTGRIDCFCFARIGGALTLEFRDDKLVTARDSSGRVWTPPPSWSRHFSAPSLFAAADDAIRRVELFVLKIEYDAMYGIPTTIDTDSAQLATDGWFRQYVTNFRVIR